MRAKTNRVEAEVTETEVVYFEGEYIGTLMCAGGLWSASGVHGQHPTKEKAKAPLIAIFAASAARRAANRGR